MNLSIDTLNFLARGCSLGERNAKLFKATRDFAKCGYSRSKAEWELFYICKKMEISYPDLNDCLEHAYCMI